jgi:hypothetical protein
MGRPRKIFHEKSSFKIIFPARAWQSRREGSRAKPRVLAAKVLAMSQRLCFVYSMSLTQICSMENPLAPKHVAFTSHVGGNRFWTQIGQVTSSRGAGGRPIWLRKVGWFTARWMDCDDRGRFSYPVIPNPDDLLEWSAVSALFVVQLVETGTAGIWVLRPETINEIKELESRFRARVLPDPTLDAPLISLIPPIGLMLRTKVHARLRVPRGSAVITQDAEVPSALALLRLIAPRWKTQASFARRPLTIVRHKVLDSRALIAALGEGWDFASIRGTVGWGRVSWVDENTDKATPLFLSFKEATNPYSTPPGRGLGVGSFRLSFRLRRDNDERCRL